MNKDVCKYKFEEKKIRNNSWTLTLWPNNDWEFAGNFVLKILKSDFYYTILLLYICLVFMIKTRMTALIKAKLKESED